MREMCLDHLVSRVPTRKLSLVQFPGWSRSLIQAWVELWKVKGQPEAPPWLAPMGKISKIVYNLRQFVPTILSKYWKKFILFTALICSDSTFNLGKRVTNGSFFILSKTLVFLFLPFLNLGAQITSPKNRYNDKSALDQPLVSSI